MSRATLPATNVDRCDCYLPTPEEIRAACLEIQAEWTEEERRRRRALPPKRSRNVTYTLPRLRVSVPVENSWVYAGT